MNESEMYESEMDKWVKKVRSHFGPRWPTLPEMKQLEVLGEKWMNEKDTNVTKEVNECKWH